MTRRYPLLLLLVASCAAEVPAPTPVPDAESPAESDVAPIEDAAAAPDAGDPGDASPAEDTPLPEDTAPEDIEDTEDTTPEDTASGDTGEDAPDVPPAPTPWRSVLYPDTWTPAHTTAEGDYLPDFSYAGYRNGEAPLPTPEGPLIDVVADHGADASGQADATAAFQAAVDAAEALGGAVVVIPPGDYRLDGTVTVQHSGVVLRGAGADATRLRFTAHQGVGYGAHLTFAGSDATGLEVPLISDGAERSAVVQVADAGGLAPGDDVVVGQVITDAFIAAHGMTGIWKAFNGTWQPFFRRDIVAVDTTVTPHEVTLDVPLRYPLAVAHGASIRRQSGLLSEVGVEHLSVTNVVAMTDAWAQNQVHAIALSGVRDAWVRGVRSFDPDGGGYHLQSSGVLVRYAKRVTVTDTDLGYSQHRGGGGNGYLFEVRQSSEVLFANCTATAGRHNFIQNWGFGASGVVWHRVVSRDSAAILHPDYLDLAIPAKSETHHSLAMSCLVDDSVMDDGFIVQNRKHESTGAGHTGTRIVLWNTQGKGWLLSFQFDRGYVVGTGPDITLTTALTDFGAVGTEPQDLVEGKGEGATLEPPSLYLDQLARRLTPAAP